MTAQTRRRKFIKSARKESYQKGRRDTEDQFHEWYSEAVRLAKKGKWEMLEKGPAFLRKVTIKCTADIHSLFVRAQHDLESKFEEVLGEKSVWAGMEQLPKSGEAFAKAVIERGNKKLKKSGA